MCILNISASWSRYLWSFEEFELTDNIAAAAQNQCGHFAAGKSLWASDWRSIPTEANGGSRMRN